MSTGGTIPLGSMTLDATQFLKATATISANMEKLGKGIERTMQGSAAQTKKLTGALGQIGGAMLKATRAMADGTKDMNVSLHKLNGNMAALAVQLSNSFSRANQSLAALTKTVNSTNQQIGQLTETVNQLAQQVQAGFQQVIRQQQETDKEAAASTTTWQRFGETGRRAVEGLRRSLEPLRGKAHEVGMALGALGAATAGLGIAGVKVGNSYELSMARVKGITRATAAEMREMDVAAQALGVSTIHSAKDAAEGMAMMAQGGYSVTQIIKGMPAVFQLVDVAQTDTASAAHVLVNVMEAMHVPVDQLEGSVDMLAKALSMGGNNLEELATGFRYAGPLAKSLNIPLNEVLATLQLLGKQGIQGSMAGTTIRQMLTVLATMPAQAKKDFKKLGINIYDEAGKITSSLPNIFDELARGFAKSDRLGGSAANIMQDFNARAGGGVTAILNAIEGQRDILSKAAEKIGGAVGEKFSLGVQQEMQDTLPSRLSMVVGTLSGFGITLQKRLAPAWKGALVGFNQWMSDNKEKIDAFVGRTADKMQELVASFTSAASRIYNAWEPTLKSLWAEVEHVYNGFMQWFDSLPPGVQDAMKVAAGMTAISFAIGKIGGMIPFLGEAMRGIGGLINPVNLLSTAVGAFLPLLSGGGGLIGLFGMLFSPAGLVLAGIAALTALVGYMHGDVPGAFKALAEVIDVALVGTLTRAINLFGELKGAVADVLAQRKIVNQSEQQKQAYRESVKQNYGEGAAADLQAYEAAQTALVSRRRQVTAAREKARFNARAKNGYGQATGPVDRQKFLAEVNEIENQAAPEIARLVEAEEKARLKLERTLREKAAEKEAASEPPEPEQLFRMGSKKELEDEGRQERQKRIRETVKGIADKGAAVGRFLMGKGPVGEREAERRGKAMDEIAALFKSGAIGEAIAKGEAEYKQQNAAQVALGDKAVAAAEASAEIARQKGLKSTQTAPLQFGQSQQRGNQAILAANQQQMLHQAGGMTGAAGRAAAIAAGVIGQIGAQVSRAMAGFDKLTEEQKGAAVQLHDVYQNLVAQFKAGILTQKQFNDQVKAAADAANKLAGAEDRAADGKGGQGGGALGFAQMLDNASRQMQNAFNAIMAPFNAFGQFMQQLMAPWQQAQQAAQQMQQFQQDAAQNPLLNPAGFALQGGEDLQQNLADAIKTGDPAQIRDAVQKMKDYANAQIQLTLHNAAMATGDIQNISGFGIHAAGTDAANIAVGLAKNPQAAATVKQFQQQIAQLDALLGKMPKMAAGGLVTSPTAALIGEGGPEAVIPLNRLAQWFGAPQNIFPANGQFRFDPGGMQFNPFGITGGRLGLFDQRFNLAGSILSRQMDLGNLGAGGILGRWGQAQQALEDSLSYIDRRRSIELGGNAGWGGTPGNTLHFNFGNIHLASATDEQISSLYDRIEQEALRRGYSATSNRRNAIGGYSANGRGSPLQPSGQAR